MSWWICIFAIVVLIITVVVVRLSSTLFPRQGPPGPVGEDGLDGPEGAKGAEGPPGFNSLPGNLSILTSSAVAAPYTPEEAYALGSGVYYQLVNESNGSPYTIYTTMVIRNGTEAERSLSLRDAITFQPRIQNVMQMIYVYSGNRLRRQIREALLSGTGLVIWSAWLTNSS